MTAKEYIEIEDELGVPARVIADTLGVKSSTVYNWRRLGVSGVSAMAIRFAARLDRLGLAWKKGEVNVVVEDDGNILMDVEDMKALLFRFMQESKDAV